MPVIVVKKTFSHADDGNHVVEYAPGEHEVSERCAEVAVTQLKRATVKSSKSSKKAEAEAKAEAGSGSDQ